MAATVAKFSGYGDLAGQTARDNAAVLGHHEGRFRNPERISHLFRERRARCARARGEDAPPPIRPHDLRHTHATIPLRDRENVKVVRAARPCQRDDHARCVQHVMPGDQRQAAARFAALVAGTEA